MISYSVPDMPQDLSISAAAIDPDNFRVCCGTEFPSALLYNFEDDLPIASGFSFNKNVTAVKFV